MPKKKVKKEDDINTAIGMLRYILVKNEHGVWFIEIDNLYQLVPRWMRGHCEKAVPNPRIIK